MSIEHITDIAAAVTLIFGTSAAALGALGMLRMPDPYMRAQAAAKPAALGLAAIFTAVAIHLADSASIAKCLGTVAFAFLSIPLGAHMITLATHDAGVPIGPPGATDELHERDAREDTSTEDLGSKSRCSD